MFSSSCHPLILLFTVTAVTFFVYKDRIGHLTKPQSNFNARKKRILAKFELVGRVHKCVFGLKVL